MKINIKSEKGAAIVLVAILVTGIVMLVSVIAIENLRKSTELSGVQKKSLDSLYKAEEGAEYGLFINKEKPLVQVNNETDCDNSRPFNISVWEKVGNESSTKKCNQALEQLAQPTEGRNIVITSQSQANANDNQGASPQKTVFTNLPNKYFDQVPLWNILEGCDLKTEDCVTYENNDMEAGRTYQVVVPSAVFEQSGWNDEETEYRLVFKCGNSQYWSGSQNGTENVEGCRISNVTLKVSGCDTSTCKIEGCTNNIGPIKSSSGNDQLEGKIIPTEWFRIDDPNNGNPINLTGEKVVVEFTLEEGSMEEVSFSGMQGEIRMCKQDNGNSWITYKDRQGGLSSLETRKAYAYKYNPEEGGIEDPNSSHYSCCGYGQICDQWEQICDQWKQICTGYSQVCCATDPCSGACTKNCNGDCNQWANGACTNYHNGACTHYHNGNCIQWCAQ